MIRILHTADLHIDTPFSGSGWSRDQAMQRRADLFSVFNGIIDLVEEREVDLILIAGDLFEEEYLSSISFRRIMSRLADIAPRPVVISPGNHDPYHKGSPYATEELPDNLFIFRENSIECIDLPEINVSVYGVAFNNAHETQEIWQDFRVESMSTEEKVKLVLSHGAAYEGEPGQAIDYLPIQLDHLRRSGADYCALGHYHTKQIISELQNDTQFIAVYPGSPEPLRFGQEEDHGIVLLSVDPDSKKCEIEHVVTQKRKYHRITLDLNDISDITEFEAAIRRIFDSFALKDNPVELVLNGRIPPEVQFIQSNLLEETSKCFSCKIVDKTHPDYDLIAIASEGTAKGAFCRALLEKMDSADEEEKKIIKQALWLGLAAFEGSSIEDFPL